MVTDFDLIEKLYDKVHNEKLNLAKASIVSLGVHIISKLVNVYAVDYSTTIRTLLYLLQYEWCDDILQWIFEVSHDNTNAIHNGPFCEHKIVVI